MKVCEALKNAWNIVKTEADMSPGYYHRRIQQGDHLPVYTGILYPGGYKRLSFEVEKKAIKQTSLKDETRGYVVDVTALPSGSGGKVFIHITETGPAYASLFEIVCADILEQWIKHDTDKAAVDNLHRRLLHWRHFFQRGDDGLSREEYIGLYAELEFLELLIDHGTDAEFCLNAWRGPLGANQDFLFGPLAVEVKCSTSNTIDRVKVSNERQLDSKGLDLLFLFYAAYDFRENNGKTLKQLVLDLGKRLAAISEIALVTFEDRLIAAGYTSKIPCAYDSSGFVERRKSVFNVREGFPRIVESVLAEGVSMVTYHVNLAACNRFMVDNQSLVAAIKDVDLYEH